MVKRERRQQKTPPILSLSQDGDVLLPNTVFALD